MMHATSTLRAGCIPPAPCKQSCRSAEPSDDGGGEATLTSATIAILDAALAHLPRPPTTEPLLMCGLADTAPVATTVPYVVRSTCTRFRDCLLRRRWLRGCSLFVHFVARLTRHEPLSHTHCPHRRTGQPGSAARERLPILQRHAALAHHNPCGDLRGSGGATPPAP